MKSNTVLLVLWAPLWGLLALGKKWFVFYISIKKSHLAYYIWDIHKHGTGHHYVMMNQHAMNPTRYMQGNSTPQMSVTWAWSLKMEFPLKERKRDTYVSTIFHNRLRRGFTVLYCTSSYIYIILAFMYSRS